MSKIFIDTNILLYALDRNDPKKQKYCKKALQDIIKKDTPGVISTQILQEFYVAATRKMGVEPILAKRILQSFDNFEVILVDTHLIKEAIDCSILNQISFWDALIVICAQSAKCDKIWTEDLNHGQVIHGIQIENILKNI